MSEATQTPAAPAEGAPAAAQSAAPPDTASPIDDRGALVRAARESGALGADGKLTGQDPAAPAAAPDAGDDDEQAIDSAPDTAAGDAAKDALNDAAAAGATREQLEALAKQLGFVIDDRKIYTRERADFREHQRKLKAGIERSKQEALEEIARREQEHIERLQRAEAISQALEGLDLDALAKLKGMKDANELMEAYGNKMIDPNFREIQELKRALAEKEQREAEERRRYLEQQRAIEERERISRYLGRLSQQMAQSQDPLCRELHDDPEFVRAVARVQQQYWDDETKTTISPERAIKTALRTAGGTGGVLYDQMRRLYDRLHRAFSAGEVSQAAIAQAATAATTGPAPAPPPAQSEANGKAKSKANKTQVVKGPPVEPAAEAEWKDDNEFIRYAVAKMKAAQEKP